MLSLNSFLDYFFQNSCRGIFFLITEQKIGKLFISVTIEDIVLGTFKGNDDK